MVYTRTLNKFGVPLYSTGGDAGKIGMLQPKPKHRFRVRVAGFGNNIYQEDLTRMVSNVGKPSINYNTVTVDSYNSKEYYAGKHEWQSIQLSVRDDISNTATKLVGNQIQKQLNHFEQTGYVAGVNYKFVMWIEILDGGNIKILEQWFLEGCYLESIQYGDLNYSDDAPQQIDMTIRYDNAQYWGEDGSEVTMMNPAPNNGPNQTDINTSNAGLG